jgi:hypothetical protein
VTYYTSALATTDTYNVRPMHRPILPGELTPLRAPSHGSAAPTLFPVGAAA